MIVVNCSFCSWQEDCKTPCHTPPKKKKEKSTESFEEIFKKELTKDKE